MSKVCAIGAAALCGLNLTGFTTSTWAAEASTYPSKSVRVLVGLAPGGGTDITGRILMQKLTDRLGQSFLIDNRPGAGSILACDLAAKAPADGYTLLFVSPEFAVNPSLHKSVPYDPVTSFAPIAQAVRGQYFVSVHSSVAAKSIRELIALSKSSPGVTYASSGTGSANHLAGELFKTMAHVDMVHVPYKGSGPAVTALLANEVQVLFSSTSAVVPHMKTNRIRVLAATGPKRSFVAPDIPTVSEAGVPGYEVTGWFGLLAPAKTPGSVIALLNQQVNQALPELKDRYAELGTELVGGSSAQFADLIKSEVKKWAMVVRVSGATAE
jgi:tripartite-type tricarboxylate transporter receptor subunit TctC